MELQGFVHSSIELGEETIAKARRKNRCLHAHLSVTTRLSSMIFPALDAVMLVSTTGHFMMPQPGRQ